MRSRGWGIAAVILLFIGTIIFTFYYGPSKRVFVTPGKTVLISSAQELDKLLLSTGVHGRIAVIFTRHLKPQVTGTFFPEIDYLDRAMSQGIVRTAFYIVPDRMWTQVVAENILNQGLIVPPKTTETGFILLHRGGRVHVMPLSKFIPEQEREKALVIIEPGAWAPQEQLKIDNYFRSGLLTSDLVIKIR